MTRKKKGQKKSSQKKKLKKVKTNPASQFGKIFFGLSILACFVVSAGVLAHFLIPKYSVESEKIVIWESISEKPSKENPAFEIYPVEENQHPVPPPDRQRDIDGQLPQIAIVIDDLGYDKRIAKKFLNLNVELTFSILPQSPFQKTIARAAHDKGIEVMLHLPMEPNEYPEVHPGPGTLLTSMSPDTLLEQLKADLDAFPYIAGVNNHMGSKMTTVSTQMYQIFSVLKQRDLFFIDSRTTPESLCKPSARLLQIRFAERDVFLDHFHESDAIRKEIRRMIKIASKYGQAIGIGHPGKNTFKVLQEMLPELQKKVRLVPASEIVEVIRPS